MIIAVCDHYEPFHKTDRAGALQRVQQWRDQYPEQTRRFTDTAGNTPKHSFFYPIEQYDEEILAGIAKLCAATGSETEIHLHHADDTEAGLRAAIKQGQRDLSAHGFLSGGSAYGFIHGNWAIANCHPDGTHCGVDNEIALLCETGCYGDFTMPSAPHPTQLARINSIYYADCDATGREAASGGPTPPEEGGLLMVQGPLGLNWRRRKLGLFPRLENADLTAANPPTAERLRLWSALAPRVATRPDWTFVKLHTHGALPKNTRMFLSEDMENFHTALQQSGTPYYYVTARQMVNLIHAAEAGCTGTPAEHLNDRYPPPALLA